MDQLLPKLLTFPPHPAPATPLADKEYDTKISNLLKTLNCTPASTFVEPINNENILAVIDPSVNSLPYLYAILAQITSSKSQVTPGTAVWKAIERFINGSDPVQIRYAGAQWKALVDELLELGSRTADAATASQALDLVERALLKIDPETSTLTSTHLDLVRACLRRRLYASCLRVLNNDIYHFPTDSVTNKNIPSPHGQHDTSSTFITTGSGFTARLTHKDVLQYFLLGGMVFISQRQWPRALDFLETTLVYPVHGNTVSWIQVEAYKKWILVSILHHGRPGFLPRSVSQQVSKLLTSLAKPYTVLADAFKDESPTRLRAEYDSAARDQIWESDNNLGLIRLVLSAHRRSQVHNYGQIYSSISVNYLAEMMSMSSGQSADAGAIEAEIRHLVHSQSIHAVMVPGKDGSQFIKFLSPTGAAPVPEAQQTTELATTLAHVNTLNTHLRNAKSRLEFTKEYIEATKKRRKPIKDGQEGLSGFAGDIQGGIDEEMLDQL